MSTRRAKRIAVVLTRASRAAARLLPASIRQQLEDRVFYAIFNLTRVTNDAYGWRPPAPTEDPP